MNVRRQTSHLILTFVASLSLALLSGCGGEDQTTQVVPQAPVAPTQPNNVPSGGFFPTYPTPQAGNCGFASGSYPLPVGQSQTFQGTMIGQNGGFAQNMLRDFSVSLVSQPQFGSALAQANARTQILFPDINALLGYPNTGSIQNVACLQTNYPGEVYATHNNGPIYFRGTLSGQVPVSGGVGFQGQVGNVNIEVFLVGPSCNPQDGAILYNGRIQGCAIVSITDQNQYLYGGNQGGFAPTGYSGRQFFYRVQ